MQFVKLEMLSATIGCGPPLEAGVPLGAMTSECEVYRCKFITFNISGSKILDIDPFPQCCTERVDVHDEALGLFLDEEASEAVFFYIPRNGRI